MKEAEGKTSRAEYRHLCGTDRFCLISKHVNHFLGAKFLQESSFLCLRAKNHACRESKSMALGLPIMKTSAVSQVIRSPLVAWTH